MGKLIINGYITFGWWFQSFSIFHDIYGIILPIDELIFSRWLKPPTRKDRMGLLEDSIPQKSHGWLCCSLNNCGS